MRVLTIIIQYSYCRTHQYQDALKIRKSPCVNTSPRLVTRVIIMKFQSFSELSTISYGIF